MRFQASGFLSAGGKGSGEMRRQLRLAIEIGEGRVQGRGRAGAGHDGGKGGERIGNLARFVRIQDAAARPQKHKDVVADPGFRHQGQVDPLQARVAFTSGEVTGAFKDAHGNANAHAQAPPLLSTRTRASPMRQASAALGRPDS